MIGNPRGVAVAALVFAGMLFGATMRAAAEQDAAAGPTVVAPESLGGLAERVRDSFARLAARVTNELGAPVPVSPTIFIEPDAEALVARLVERSGGSLPDGGRHILGVALGGEPTLMLNVEAIRASVGPGWSFAYAVEATLVHELAHLALDAYERRGRFPRWFEEGMCQWIEPSSPNVSRAIINVRTGIADPPALSAIDRRIADGIDMPFAYALAESAAGAWMRRYDAEALRKVMAEFARTGDFAAAHLAATGETVAVFEAAWLDEAAPGGWSAAFDFLGYYSFQLLIGAALLIAIVGAYFRKKRDRAEIQRMADAERYDLPY